MDLPDSVSENRFRPLPHLAASQYGLLVGFFGTGQTRRNLIACKRELR